MSLAERTRHFGGRVGREIQKPESMAQWFLAIVLGGMVIVPLIFLTLMAFGATSLLEGIPTTFTFEAMNEALNEPQFQQAFINTFIYVAGTLVWAHFLGFVCAYILTKMDIPHASKFHTMMFLPIFVSPLILAMGWNFTMIEGGMYHAVLRSTLGITIDINNVYGMIFVSGFYQLPYAYAFISSGMQNVSTELEYAAQITGAGRWTILRRITLPLIKPFILSSMFLLLLLGFQAVSAPLILGGPQRIYVLSTFLISLQNFFPPPYGMMASIGFIMVIVSFVLATLTGRLTGDAAQYTVVSGRGAQSTTHTPRHLKLLGGGFITALIFFGVVMPFLQLFILGILEGRAWAIENLTTANFVGLFSSDLATSAIQNSLLIAVVTASISVLVTAYVAYVKARENNLRSRLISWLAWIPIATPGVVLGIAYLWTYLWIPVGIYGTIFALMLAYLVRFLALGTRMNESLIVQQSPTLDEQGKICGAGLIARLRNIIFPNMKSGMISIWVILFALFMNELSTSIFLYTSSSRVFTVTLYELWSTAQISTLAALAITQVAITLTVISIGMWYFDIDIRVA